MVIEPTLHPPTGPDQGVLAWRWTESMQVLSSAPVGGGLSEAEWLINIGVPLRYTRTDLSQHVNEVAVDLGLQGKGIGLFTAAKVSRVQRATCGGVSVDATVGISKPTWAADPSGGFTPWSPGTINVVIQVPVALDHGAAVNAVITATEAKTQALHERNVPGTGTASDAIVIVWAKSVWPEAGEAERFAGPRSAWGARIAQATHEAVQAGIDRWSA